MTARPQMKLQKNGNIIAVEKELSGVLAVDKEASMTSFDVVSAIRRATGVRRVGHTGTLDPFATGILPICIGDATKIVPFLMDGTKEYFATARFGLETTTGDPEGDIVAHGNYDGLDPGQVVEISRQFVGHIAQRPPLYSAIKVKGKRLYEFARANIDVDIPERAVQIQDIQLVNWNAPVAVFQITCSKGTYIRSLIRDIGRIAGCFATLTELRRTQTGGLSVQNSVTVSEIRSLSKEGLAQRIISVDNALAHLPELKVDSEIAWRIGVGQKLSTGQLLGLPAENIPFRVVGFNESTIAIAVHSGGLVRVVRGLQPQQPKTLKPIAVP